MQQTFQEGPSHIVSTYNLSITNYDHNNKHDNPKNYF
jgi:hypothetical protein